jgi:hypothetical protein
MGTLVHQDRTLTIDDRLLAHLQVVIVNKLRRHESFTFTWSDDDHDTVCWIGPSMALEFVYSGNRRPLLNREWLELLARSANSTAGLIAVPEPAPATRLDNRRVRVPVSA